jgi:ATP-dependent RNA helicase DDX46/PRP5
MFRHIMDQPPHDPSDGPIALIMVPTRELAVQIHAECSKFVKATNIRSACVYGGAGVKHQIGDLKRGAEVVVCTPGRMIDVLCANKGRVTNLKRVTYLVLDEADRMFDMGFEPQITRIIQNIRPGRQTVLFSATFPRSVEVAARRILIKPVEISIAGKGVVADTIQQQVKVITEENKVKVLLECIADWYDKGSILIFVDTQESTDILWREILKSGYTSCGSLHGGKEQLDRDFTLKIFKSGEMKILVATSVAARGLDVPSIRCVINFDCPNHLEDYVHRCGRTGRAGVPGTAITFLTPSQEQYSRDLVKAITASGQDVPPDLAKIYNDFESKRKAGVVQKHKSQFLNSKGFKFDDAEDKAKGDLLKIQKMSYGVTQGEEYDINADSDEDIDDDDEEFVVRDDGLSVTQALTQELMTSQGPGGANAGDRAKQFASEIVSKAASKLHSAMRYSEELEVNDYPQNARWKVLNQAGLATITEITGCGLTTKGTHVAPGRNPPPGQRKLFLFIEGNTVDEVKKAKYEVKRMLDEAVQTGRPDAQQSYGKYSV